MAYSINDIINLVGKALGIKHKLSDEGEKLLSDYTQSQSKYSDVLFYDYSGERQNKIEAAEIELNKSRLNLREYIYQLETNLNTAITYYEDELDKNKNEEEELGTRVNELEERFHNMCVKMQVMNIRITDLEEKINNHVVGTNGNKELER